MDISKIGGELIQYKPKAFEIVKEGVQVSDINDIAPTNFRTGVKIGDEVAYSMDRIYELATGTTISDIDCASNTTAKVIDFIA